MAAPVPRSAVLLLTALCCVPGCISLTMRKVSVPDLGARGKVAHLRCNFDADDEEHRAGINVTWYKDGAEFYSAVNMGLESMNTVKDVPGVIVDRDDSGPVGVTLRPLRINTGGKYHCKATSNRQSLESGTRTLRVVSNMLSGPVITGLQEGNWSPNATIDLKCISGKSYPIATLTWFVKGEEAEESQLTRYPPEKDEEGLKTSKLGLALQLGPDPRTEKVEVTCKAVFHVNFLKNMTDGLTATDLHQEATLTKIVTGGAGQLTAALLLLVCAVTGALTI